MPLLMPHRRTHRAYGRTNFLPVTPRNAKALIADRVGPHRTLTVDPGSLRSMDEEKARGHGLYLDRTGHKMLVYVEFKIHGQRFTRRATNEAIGNFGVLWVDVLGTTYSLKEH